MPNFAAYYRLESDWVLLVPSPSKPVPGSIVTARRRDGEMHQRQIVQVLGEKYPGIWICSFARGKPKDPQVPHIGWNTKVVAHAATLPRATDVKSLRALTKGKDSHFNPRTDVTYADPPLSADWDDGTVPFDPPYITKGKYHA